MKLPHRIGIPLLGLSLLSACAVLPNAKAPQSEEGQPTRTRYEADSSLPSVELTSSLRKVFSGTQLSQHLKRAQQHNPNLKTAAARLEEAGYDQLVSRSFLRPSLDTTVSAGRSRNSTSSPSNSYAATLDAQWEIDIWGRLRAGVVASQANEEAIRRDYDAASQSIAAQTAQAYFNLLAATDLISLAEERLTSFQDTYDLVNRRFEFGTTTLSDLSLAETDLENARATIALRKNNRDQAARLLAALTGRYPSANASPGPWPSLRKSVPAGLPSTLLLSRPDIQAAYARINQADANVFIAHRDLYPRFALTASTGQQSSTLHNLLEADYRPWSLAGNLTAPLFNAGALKSALGSANARAKQALTSYQSTVLTALREVENALGSESSLKQQEAATTRALKAAETAEARSLRNYESGLLEILDLLETKRRRFAAEESLIQIKSSRYQNRVALALALGKAY